MIILLQAGNLEGIFLKNLDILLRMTNNVKVEAIDLFCGAGGLTKGLEKSGIRVKLGVDVDPACEYPYSKNNSGKFLLQSVTDLGKDSIIKQYTTGAIKLLAGCAPCQTFSSYNQKATSNDERWWLLLEFARLVREVEPDLVTMENVPGLADQEVFVQFVEDLKGLEYNVSYEIIDCSEYGLAQHRKRLVLLASRYGDINVLSPQQFNRKKKTVEDVIGKLAPLRAGEVDINLRCI
jgi:DNA (cytosine-5)-methyltransferase 1